MQKTQNRGHSLEEKSYSQMRQEFREFYFNEVKPRLPKYLKMRRAEGPMQIVFWGFFCSFSLIFAFFIWFEYISKFIFAFFPNLGFLNDIMKFLCGLDVVICIISIVSLIIINWLTSNSSNTHGNTRYIQQDLEMALKQELMPKFVNIFLDKGLWYKKSLYNYQNSKLAKAADEMRDIRDIGKYNKAVIEDRNIDKQFHIKNLRSQKLLNPYPWERYEDIIWGKFKDVNIKIYEINTSILKFTEVVVIAFLFIWLSGFTAGLFTLLFLIFIVPTLVLLLLIFSFKIYQYSLFKGIVVEFEMNKKFDSHTIFYENSLLSKKIPLEKSYYKKVNLESATFEEKYNVYSNNQVEARYILTPALIERIENLKFAFNAKYVRGSFKDNKLTLAIHTGKDMFAMGSDFKDSDSHTFEMLYDEMISILQIVDELKLNENTTL